MAIITASILDADYSQLEHEVTRVANAGIDAFSLDVMDGHFVPRVTFGEYLVALIRNWIDLPIEVHLMVDEPRKWVQRICDAGADMVVFHLEAATNPEELIDHIRSEKRQVGLALKCETPLDDLPDDLMAKVDLVNLVSVPLGFGGNASAPDTFERIRVVRERALAAAIEIGIEVDGGVKPSNAAQYVEAGADMLTVGTGIYHAENANDAVRVLRETTRGPADEQARARLKEFLSIPSTTPVDDAARRARLEALRLAQDIPRKNWDPLTAPR